MADLVLRAARVAIEPADIESEDDLARDELGAADSAYFSLYGADAFAGLPVAWSAPQST